MKKDRIILIASLAALLLGALLACLVQTGFFTVSVKSKTIETMPVTSKAIAMYDKSGRPSWNTADIYMPKSASASSKVPLVMVAPGIQRTKETQASFCIELVRRGYGVICIDPYAQGDSSPSYEGQSATYEGYGLFNWLDYMYTDEGKAFFDWVDYDYIGACGHSAGGNGCQKFAEAVGKAAAAEKQESRIRSIYITGYLREWSWNSTACNVGISYSINDEGAFQNKSAKARLAAQAKADSAQALTEEEARWLEIGNADLRHAPEAIDLVNYQIRRNNAATGSSDAGIDAVEVGKGYGNRYALTYVQLNNETCLHAFQPYDKETLAHLVSFFDYTLMDVRDQNLGIQGPRLDPYDQAWWFKEIGCLIMLASGFAATLALAGLLLQTPFFKPIVKPVPSRTAEQSLRGKVIFWAVFAISASIACVLYMVCVKASVTWFPEASSGNQTWLFPQRFTNAVMMWAVANGLIGTALFFLAWALERWLDLRFSGKTAESVKASYMLKLEGARTSWGEMGRTLLLAAILVAFFYGLDYLCYLIFHVDMRFMFLSARVTFNPGVIVSVLMYLPFFFIFYLSNSLRVNCSMRPSNWSEGASKLIAVLGNTLGLVAILFIEYVPFIRSGTIGYTSTVGPQWLFVNLLFSIIPLMAALPLLNRHFFNKTGRIYLGPLVACVIFIAMTGGSTTIYYAL